MSASQPALFNLQEFSDAGITLVGGRLYTLVAGTTAFQAAYTDAAGQIPQTYTADGLGGQYIALNARGELPTPLYLGTGSYDLTLKRADGSMVWTRSAEGVDNGVNELTTSLAAFSGASLVGFKQAGIGAAMRSMQNKMGDTISVKDFGAVGDGVADDTNAILAAMAHAKLKKRSIYFPSGDYYYSSTINVPYGVRIFGESELRTRLLYHGDGDAIYMGGPGSTQIISYCMVDDLTVYCFSRAPSVNGINLDNCCYFAVNRVSVFGSGSPNSTVPADQVLYGSGVSVSNNSIIGYLNKVTTRLWATGRHYWTRPGSQSYWSAAIVDGGQGESTKNSLAFQIGDPASALGTGQGLTIRDICIQGNYAGGIWNMNGESVTIDGCYFEGNASYDVRIGGQAGNPICNRIINCVSNGGNIEANVYGNNPYVYKIHVQSGNFTTILNNDLSMPAPSAIWLIEVGAAAQDTVIELNRLNSSIDAQKRINNQSTTTTTRRNFPENPNYCNFGFIRTLSAASGNVSYTGLGFRPTELEFHGVIDGSNERSDGWGGIGQGFMTRCITTLSDGTTLSAGGITTGNVVRLVRGAIGTEQTARVVSLDADGFTLAWTKLGAPPANDMTVNVIARRAQ